MRWQFVLSNVFRGVSCAERHTKVIYGHGSDLARKSGSYFDKLEDPRSTINQKHPLVSVVVIGLMAVLAGPAARPRLPTKRSNKEDFLLQGIRLASWRAVAINYEYYLQTVHEGKTVRYILFGFHDEFPAHEVYLSYKGKVVDKNLFTPTATGWFEPLFALGAYFGRQWVMREGTFQVDDDCQRVENPTPPLVNCYPGEPGVLEDPRGNR